MTGSFCTRWRSITVALALGAHHHGGAEVGQRRPLLAQDPAGLVAAAQVLGAGIVAQSAQVDHALHARVASHAGRSCAPTRARSPRSRRVRPGPCRAPGSRPRPRPRPRRPGSRASCTSPSCSSAPSVSSSEARPRSRTRARTSCPVSMSRRASFPPTKPVAPVTSAFIPSGYVPGGRVGPPGQPSRVLAVRRKLGYVDAHELQRVPVGRPSGLAHAPGPPSPQAPQSPQGAALASPMGGTPELSSVGKRFGGYLLELVLFIVTLGIGWLIWMLVILGRGQTPAKQIMNMRVVEEATGQVPSLRQDVRARDPAQGHRHERCRAPSRSASD